MYTVEYLHLVYRYLKVSSRKLRSLQVLTFWRLRSIRLRRFTGSQQPQGRNRRQPADSCNNCCNKGCSNVNHLKMPTARHRTKNSLHRSSF